MKFLYLIALVALFSALTIEQEEPQIQVEQEIEHAHELHDSALMLLKDLSHANDSLVNVYFPL
jgi:hypothetical protein